MNQVCTTPTTNYGPIVDIIFDDQKCEIRKVYGNGRCKTYGKEFLTAFFTDCGIASGGGGGGGGGGGCTKPVIVNA